jgi:DNA-binding helix-hairpin-helix protein with protein kinase domain
LRERLEKATEQGPPSDHFLWPLALAVAEGVEGFGFVMKLRDKRFRGFVEWMKRKISPSFYALATAGFGLADSHLLLHARGFCFRDVSLGDVCFDPDTGDVCIDCGSSFENVTVSGRPGEEWGTARFMAPEIVRGEAVPTIETDRYSLAVLLFYLLMMHHPLEGKRESDLQVLDVPALRKLYGTEPVFIFDPKDESNRPAPEFHPNPLACWPIYPVFVRELFIRSFTDGLRDPIHGRVSENEWRTAMVRLRDSILHCPRCRAENFYDADTLKATGGRHPTCWNCKAQVPLPLRIRVGDHIVVLRRGTKLFPHHVDPRQRGNFSAPVAEIQEHPTTAGVLGLANVSGQPWRWLMWNGETEEIDPGTTCRLQDGMTLFFGSTIGEVRS